MMMLWAWAGVPLGVYNIVSNFNVALLVQPQILTALSLVTWIQCYYYQRVCDSPVRAHVSRPRLISFISLEMDDSTISRHSHPCSCRDGREPSCAHLRPPHS